MLWKQGVYDRHLDSAREWVFDSWWVSLYWLFSTSYSGLLQDSLWVSLADFLEPNSIWYSDQNIVLIDSSVIIIAHFLFVHSKKPLICYYIEILNRFLTTVFVCACRCACVCFKGLNLNYRGKQTGYTGWSLLKTLFSLTQAAIFRKENWR